MTDRDDRLDINTLGSLGAGHPSHVTVRRAVLAEALEQIEATWIDYTGDCGDAQCSACRVDLFDYDSKAHTYTDAHKPDCRYVRLSDYLKGLGL